MLKKLDDEEKKKRYKEAFAYTRSNKVTEKETAKHLKKLPKEMTEHEHYSEKMKKTLIKKIIFFIVIPLTLIGFIGFVLVGIGTGLPSTPITTAGIVMACVGFVPQLIFLIIHAWRKGIPIWW